MAALPSFTDAVVREMFGSQLFNKAEADLNAGRLSERLAYRNGVLTAMWDQGGRSAAPAAQFFDGEVEFNCNCQAFDRQGRCVHTAGLALTWAREPKSFVRLNEELDLDLFADPFSLLGGLLGKTDEVEADLDAGPDLLALGAPPSSAEAGSERLTLPSAPLSATTLTTQWPDLTAAYAEER